MGVAAWLQIAAVLAFVGVLHVPLGDYMARVYTGARHWRVERLVYRVCGIDPDSEQRWGAYLRSVLAFSLAGVLVLYAILRLQGRLPLGLGHPGMPAALAFNTAVSFTTNTSWQNYAGESTLGHLALATGLGTEAFASSAVGLAVGVALIRGLARHRADRLGNFWVDLVRGSLRILLPMAAVSAVVLIALGVVQDLGSWQAHTTLAGARQSILGGPIASWEPIKLMSGDGGGAFNASSAHPFENPTALTNLFEIVLMLLIPAAFIRTFGRMVGDRRQGWALLAVAGVLFVASVAGTTTAEVLHHNTVPTAVGAATEGTETRIGVPGSALFGASATSSADGAGNSSYDSFTSIGGGLLLATMMLGEVSPGGTGSGLYALIVLALLAVFLGGLMIGRTPEYLRKRIQAREIKLVSLYILTAPALILIGTALSIALPTGRASIGNPGAHGLTETAYALTSSANSNGSAFAGFTGNTPYYNVVLAVAMLLGRYLPIVFVLGLAGSLARQRRGVVTSGTLPSHKPLFIGLLTVCVLIFSALDFVLVLALGPVAEGLH
ncbi:potassium-transporting ATPase subunit KdpA [Rugosimonospora acidiphila]|uniref:Potassium-transporting ATPase potassium-binding subunit n=1 Tax=Rugosimonospora acidiphila TaxID=556531 RepID=A0ABP9RVW4_9ACTN